MFVYTVEHRTEKGWEILSEPVAYHLAIAAFRDALMDGLPVRLKAENMSCPACDQGLSWDGHTQHNEKCPERVS